MNTLQNNPYETVETRGEVAEVRQVELENLAMNGEASPGPGHYADIYSQSSFVKKQSPSKF